MTTSPTLAAEFDADFTGELLDPAAPGYDRARRVWNGMFDRRPALIARCRRPEDVAAALAFAGRRGLPVTVRGGGHNVGATSVADGALLVDLSGMTGVRADPAARVAHAGGGARLGDVDAATTPHGLAVPTGVVSRTGLGGLALGGGFGWMTRKWGLTCDHIIAAEVVLADGTVVAADDTSHPELMWALRGGGGNFGVVTRFTLALRPVGEVVRHAIVFPKATVPAAIGAFRDVVADAPDDLQISGVLPGAGQPGATFTVIWHGEPGAETALLRPFEAAGATGWRRSMISYAELQSSLDDIEPDGRRYYTKSTYIAECTDATIAHLAAAAGANPSPMSTIDLAHLGGAVARVRPAATAFAGRDAPFLFSASAAWEDPGADAENIAWARSAVAGLAPWRHTGTYPNYLPQDDGPPAELFGPNYGRLRRLKAAVDPHNVLRGNQNIAPAHTGGTEPS